jgi:hypothetical protein
MNPRENLLFTQWYAGQGLGNQLWVYAVCRSIAEHLSAPFAVQGVEKFKGSDFLRLETTLGIEQAKAQQIIEQSKENGSLRSFHETTYFDPELDYFSSGFDDRVEKIYGVTKLDGLFQSEKYFFGNLEKLKEYFVIDPRVLEKNRVGSDVGVINLRGGEYKRHNALILPESYWINAIKNLKAQADIRQFLVVTDDRAYAKALFPKFDILDGGIGDCYATLYNAKHLILSNSSFAYFPVKTSPNVNSVIAPQYWARFGNSFKRWASVANCYKDWQWQGFDGSLQSYEACLPEVTATEELYESTYYLRTTQDEVHKKPLRSLLPQPIRKAIKKTLGLIFPKWIG